MTAVPLFDALVHETGPGVPDAVRPGRLAELAGQLIEASLSDLQRIGSYERQYGSPDINAEGAIEILRSVYRLYEQWADDAEQIRVRAAQCATAGRPLPQAEALDDALGRIRARLGVTPEKMARAIEQVRQGRLVPVEEVRDELRARVHG